MNRLTKKKKPKRTPKKPRVRGSYKRKRKPSSQILNKFTARISEETKKRLQKLVRQKKIKSINNYINNSLERCMNEDGFINNN